MGAQPWPQIGAALLASADLPSHAVVMLTRTFAVCSATFVNCCLFFVAAFYPYAPSFSGLQEAE